MPALQVVPEEISNTPLQCVQRARRETGRIENVHDEDLALQVGAQRSGQQGYRVGHQHPGRGSVQPHFVAQDTRVDGQPGVQGPGGNVDAAAQRIPEKVRQEPCKSRERPSVRRRRDSGHDSCEDNHGYANRPAPTAAENCPQDGKTQRAHGQPTRAEIFCLPGANLGRNRHERLSPRSSKIYTIRECGELHRKTLQDSRRTEDRQVASGTATPASAVVCTVIGEARRGRRADPDFKTPSTAC